jgi:alpha-galactosidase
MIQDLMNLRIASFRLGGEKIELIPARMRKSADSYSMTVGRLTVILDLVPVAQEFRRWTVRLKNGGAEKTQQITEFFGIDLDFPVRGAVRWESLRGDSCGLSSFLPKALDLENGTVIRTEAGEGRSSKGDGFPYFDLTDGERSAVFAIGWTGQWSCSVGRRGDTVTVKAGFPDCDFYLNPGEEARSCGALLCCGGPLTSARQRFRRIFREKLSPAAAYGGKLEIPLSLQVFDRYFRKDPFWATEEGQLFSVGRAEECGYFNTYWLDAAWFRDGFPSGVGNYAFEPTFPNGLLPVSEKVHAAGLNFMVWFEPERNHRASDTAREHPEFLLDRGDPDDPNRLFNLADENAYLWLRNTLIRLIRENGIDIYRQDCNIDPLYWWEANEEEGRKGYLENRYVANLYRLLDALRAEFPGLLIDNCASGGNRLDFEMNCRSVPMWRSDTGCFPASEERPTHLYNQNQTLGLSRYLPYHATAVWTSESYAFRSAATMGLACNFDVLNDAFDAGETQLPLQEFVSLRKYWDGDFRPLTPASEKTDCWAAWQLTLDGDGFCAFFRRGESKEERKTFRLENIDLGRMYTVTLTDGNYIKSVSLRSGKDLAEFEAVIPLPEDSLILEYRILGPADI